MRIIVKAFFVLLSLSVLIMQPTASYAYWHSRTYVGVNLGVWPGPYYYGNPYYYPYYSEPYYPSYAVVSTSPSFQPVVVNGSTYYLNNGVYYIYTQYGYQAVAAPAGVSVPVVQQAAPVASAAINPDTVSDNSMTINIPNNKGGYTAVLLKKSGNGYTGPQGEFYSDFPKVSQLQAMYGK